MSDFTTALAKAQAIAAKLTAEAKASGKVDTAETVTPQSIGKRYRDDDEPPSSGYRRDNSSRQDRDRYDDSSIERKPRYGLGSSERSSYGDDRYGGGGGDRYGAGGGGRGKVQIEMSIPSSMVGLVIGKAGENMKRIEKDANVRIQFSSDQPQNDPERRTTIIGTDEDAKAAKRMIQEILDGANAGKKVFGGSHIDYGGGPVGHYGPSKGANVHPMEVPANKVGLVIGRGGETIKMLQEKSGAKIAVVPDSASDPKANTRTVNITGSEDQIENAKSLIGEIVFGGRDGKYGPGGGGGGGQMGPECEELKIPNDRVGLVIGKNGEAIKSIQGNFNVRVVIEQQPNPQNERSIKIYGTRDDILGAVEAILEKTMRTGKGGGGGQGGYGGYSGGDGYGGYNQQGGDYNQQQQYWDQSGGASYGGYDASQYYGQGQGQAAAGSQDPAANAAAWEAYYAYYAQYGGQPPATEGGAPGAPGAPESAGKEGGR
ncbi:Far upstream element-binding protein 1 [Irineochytrium annulatum]|nr:Far upstream element-binding protein 1 [Irineochytrium annulatum]